MRRNILTLRFAVAVSTLVLFSSCAPSETREGADSELSATQAEQIQTGEVILLSPEEFDASVNGGGRSIPVLDVRSPQEMKGGCIEGAVLANLNDKALFASRTENLDPAQPVWVYCEVGGRSKIAADLLSKRGFKVYDLRGGMRAWRSAKFKISYPDGNL